MTLSIQEAREKIKKKNHGFWEVPPSISTLQREEEGRRKEEGRRSKGTEGKRRKRRIKEMKSV